jgi:hypothetical protein
MLGPPGRNIIEGGSLAGGVGGRSSDAFVASATLAGSSGITVRFVVLRPKSRSARSREETEDDVSIVGTCADASFAVVEEQRERGFR